MCVQVIFSIADVILSDNHLHLYLMMNLCNTREESDLYRKTTQKNLVGQFHSYSLDYSLDQSGVFANSIQGLIYTKLVPPSIT